MRKFRSFADLLIRIRRSGRGGTSWTELVRTCDTLDMSRNRPHAFFQAIVRNRQPTANDWHELFWFRE